MNVLHRVIILGQTLIYKILASHLVEGKIAAGEQIGIRIDQTLTQDATGTTAFLLFESMGVKRVKTNLSVSYIDHNMSQFGPENHNDHLYLRQYRLKPVSNTHGQATVFAIRSILSGSANPE